MQTNDFLGQVVFTQKTSRCSAFLQSLSNVCLRFLRQMTQAEIKIHLYSEAKGEDDRIPIEFQKHQHFKLEVKI